MKVLGITGGIGSGKSLVCQILRALEVPVYDMDHRAKRLYDTDPQLKQSMIDLLGEEIYRSSPDGTLNRAMLSGLIFSDNALLQSVNALVHPAVRADLQRWIIQQSEQGEKLIALESALLLSSDNLPNMVDHIVVVTAPEALRLERAMARDGVAREAILQRMDKQLPQEAMCAQADSLIINDGRALLPQVVDLFTRLS